MPNPEPIADPTDDEEEEDVANCPPATMIDRNLGYFLGFRLKKSLRPMPGDPVDSPGGAIYRNLTAGASVVADTQCDLRPPSYIVLVLDDGNHNYANESLERISDEIGSSGPNRLSQIKAAAEELLECNSELRGPGDALFKK